MPNPTHDEISLQALQLWRNRGCPAGCDIEIWLEVERKLTDESAADALILHARAEMTSESEIEFHLSPAQTEQKSIQVAVQADAARAPQVPHHTALKNKPAETGKPLRPRPHSS